MTIEVKPETKQRLQQELENGHFRSIDDLIDASLTALHQTKQRTDTNQEERRRRAKSAATHIRELRKGLSLSGLKIKDLIEEGRM